MGQVEVPMGPTPLVIASRFRPVWRRPCTRWRSAPGRASTDSKHAEEEEEEEEFIRIQWIL